MKLFIRIGLFAIFVTLALSCVRDLEEVVPSPVPDGTPVTLRIDFGSSEMVQLDVSTKAEASEADESRVQDLYVMIFDNTSLLNGSPKKIYGRYFAYNHLASDLSSMDADPNEGWWVENKTLPGISPAVTTTAGAVKISTITCNDAYLVVLANVTNAVSSMSDDPNLDDIAYLNGIQTLQELKGTKVKLEQDVVNRKDLFLMMGTLGKEGASGAGTQLNTSDMSWGSTPKNYDATYKVQLHALDAKVKFMVRSNRDYIDEEKAVYWKVCNTPDRCYLFSDYNEGAAPDDIVYFDSEQAYFEGTSTADESGYSDWYIFSFYMLENRQEKKAHASSYHDREKQDKINTGESGYEWWWIDGEGKHTSTGNYVNNGRWLYANDYATYVQFDMILTLNSDGIMAATGESVNNALTTDTIYSVHLGDFRSSGSLVENAFDDYNTLRSHYYTYKITINNSGSIYAEVENDNERQSGQEGYLLLTNDEIVNADAHYEYHKVSFTYNPSLDPSIFSWYVKTPFGEGEPKKSTETVGGITYPLYSSDGLDYKWVMFSVNDPDSVDPSKYSDNRKKYPGIGQYNETWKPSSGNPHPALMDINQLIEYLFDQTNKEKAYQQNNSNPPSEFLSGEIKVTIYIDEYYYEKNPLIPDASADPDLWRKFVNAEPREMHILSDARQSRDRKSDVILSSHSIIQQSIQTIYNTYAPGLRTLWGCEHLDEIKAKVPAGWHYWPAGCDYDERSGKDDNIGRENGRLNTAYIWKVYSSQSGSGTDDNERLWETYMNFDVDNDTPELKDKYKGLAFSCMTRNRDNDGNGKIDRNEIRWYMASTRQLVGMWVGNESLSLSARLYQPAAGQWRAHVVSSTAKKVCWSEEGAGATDMVHDWAGASSAYATWNTEDEAAAGESVRCLRNIGTYDGPSGVTDISYAPYNQEIDKYFEISTEGSGVDETTTFYFDRLNTKSIREYSEGELPYHAQTSLNNRVYLKMSAQPLSTQVDAFAGVLPQDINPNISAAGRNPYCPEGWRLPNQTEFLLMSLYMSNDYFNKDKNGSTYASSPVYLPSRTFYDRGLYGSLRQESGPWSSEKNKVGWAYSTSTKKTFCTGNTSSHNMTRTRCVRDDNMTGTISGEVTMDDYTIFANDLTPVTFNFTSTASSFTYASLKLCYTAHSGNYREWDLPVETTPSGLQYRETQRIIIPNLATLGLEASDFPVSMILQAEIRNVAGQSQIVNVPVTLDNPLQGDCSINDATDSEVYPHDTNKITLHLSTKAHTLPLSGVSLNLCYDNKRIPISIPPLGSDVRAYNQANLEISIPTLAQLSGVSESDLLTGKTAHLEATVQTKTSDTETLSKTVSSADFTLSHPIVANTFSIDTDSKIYPGDSNTISLVFASQGHVPQNLSTVTVQLYDTDGETPMGNPIVDESGIAQALFSSSSSVAIPSLADLGLDVSALDPGTDYTLRAIVTNVDGLSRTIDKTLTLSNPISGSIEVPIGYVYSADDNTIGFNVSSLANTSTLTSVSMKVEYTGIDGNTHLVTSGFSSLTSPSGKSYSGNQTVTFPVFTSTPNVDAVDTSLPVTLTATFTAPGGITKDITCNVPIHSHINVPVLQIPSNYTGSSPNYVFPVEAKLGDAVVGYTISAMKLQWKKNGETVWTTDTYVFNLSDAGFQTVSDASTRASLTLSTGSYINYRAMSICSTDGTAAYSSVWSMWLARYNFVKSDTEKWSFDIQNLDIPHGDFIQASITPTGGWNVETNQSSTKYELIGFGDGDSEAVFYPAPKSATPDKTIHVQRRDGNLRVFGWYRNANNWRWKQYDNISSPINVLFNSNGLYYQNSNLFDPTKVNSDNLSDNITNLINAKRMQVGSAQGVERPYATYHFVRVVRQYEIPEP